MPKISTLVQEVLDNYGEFDENGDVVSWKGSRKPIHYESAVRGLTRDLERVIVFLTDVSKPITARYYNQLESKVLKDILKGIVTNNGVFHDILNLNSILSPAKTYQILDQLLAFFAELAPPVFVDEEANSKLSVKDKYYTLRSRAPQIDDIFDICRLVAKRDCYLFLKQVDDYTKDMTFNAKSLAYIEISEHLKQMAPQIQKTAREIDTLEKTNYHLFDTNDYGKSIIASTGIWEPSWQAHNKAKRPK